MHFTNLYFLLLILRHYNKKETRKRREVSKRKHDVVSVPHPHVQFRLTACKNNKRWFISCSMIPTHIKQIDDISSCFTSLFLMTHRHSIQQFSNFPFGAVDNATPTQRNFDF